MKKENKSKKMKDIEAAAYALLEEKGYKGTSMLAIAKKASASNQTVYKWYGSKADLFKELVAENAREIKGLLEEAIGRHDDPVDTLRIVGPKLLAMSIF